MDEIFISYKREERDIARLFADALKARGWIVWWDPKLRAGEHFDDVIEEAIKNAKCVIVLWSARSTQSRYVKDEAGYALDLGKLVPVAIDNSQLPLRFRGLHTIQLQGWKGSALVPAFQELVKVIEEKLGQSQPEMQDEPKVAQEESKDISFRSKMQETRWWKEHFEGFETPKVAQEESKDISFRSKMQETRWWKEHFETPSEKILRLIEEGNLEAACAKLGIPCPIENDTSARRSLADSIDLLPRSTIEDLFKKMIQTDKDYGSHSGFAAQMLQIAIDKGRHELAERLVDILISKG